MSNVPSLLPPNATALERGLVQASAPLGELPVPLRELWNPDTCPEHLLPWLAWSLSVDEWDGAWTVAAQRRVIAASVEIHRRKGSAAAVLQALGALGHQGRLVEWWQETPPAAPHTFRAEVEIDERGIDEDLARSIERQVAMTKPVRSHFILRLIAIGRAEVHVACAAIHGERTTVVPPIVSELQAGSPQYQAASLVTGESTTIMPPLAAGLQASVQQYHGAGMVAGELTTVYPPLATGLPVGGQQYRAAGMATGETTIVHPHGAAL
ncbi:Phage P2 baseplate assembly gpI-like protein [Azotobacter vinelandii CA]|uniref:Phage P2 baseplate assembly gpI-like protein n=2 Tax=Azotobacter vinelandii TaxID=354 RepID=C1DS15_AZOVD|nr:phage tail protein I [Azotobacter vinelandii]ACO79890.1 Phage P2 baseplate assembly gpI-like protein [Azotobacter vinelandii DJ]AGK13619.1 Phage P2 baseplate assembly gpI-like protein [Azotobacter vinelandii CA]AGK18120.1 Phage P2 baseplate assembly gpI-like protein [Azotobacter vinelandii CA6]SFX44550.1 phage tail protein, P2 protein I family [Azotobacter vinelandii]GLK62300.1 phage tail protein I [Azotobacter vinelandii]